MGIPYGEWGHFEAFKDRADLYEWRGHRGIVLDTVGDAQVIHCLSCILNHVVPLPSEAELDAYYREKFFTEIKPDYITRYEEDREWWAFVHSQTLQQAAAWLKGEGTEDGTGLSVLDVGTGPGIFLDAAKNLHWEAIGLEPAASRSSALRRQYAVRGLPVMHATLSGHIAACARSDIEIVPFDFIHVYEVLEHVREPDVFIEQCRSLLKPGGILCLVVPNDFSVLQMHACRTFGLPRWWLCVPDHLTYFTPKTLQLLVRRSGFHILDLYGTYPLEQFILTGHNYVGNDVLGRQIHHERCALELAVHAAGLWHIVLNQRRAAMQDPYSGSLGREIVLFARKT